MRTRVVRSRPTIPVRYVDNKTMTGIRTALEKLSRSALDRLGYLRP
jgi:hypothetical protein